jgi:hypothetical protein
MTRNEKSYPSNANQFSLCCLRHVKCNNIIDTLCDSLCADGCDACSQECETKNHIITFQVHYQQINLVRVGCTYVKCYKRATAIAACYRKISTEGRIQNNGRYSIALTTSWLRAFHTKMKEVQDIWSCDTSL